MTQEAAHHAKVLLGCYRTGDASDPDTYVRAVVAVLAEYPVEVIRNVCDPRFGLPAKSQWLPTIFEIKGACEVAMAPIDRKKRAAIAEEQRRTAIASPKYPRPSLDELRAKYGPTWGINVSGDKKRAAERTLDDMCREAGISPEEFEAINDKAVAWQRDMRRR